MGCDEDDEVQTDANACRVYRDDTSCFVRCALDPTDCQRAQGGEDPTNRPSDDPSIVGTGTSAGAIASGSSGVVAALFTLVTAACCVSPVIAPLIVGVLGASGVVWAAGLKPMADGFLRSRSCFIAYGFWSVHRPRTPYSVEDGPTSWQVLPWVAKGSLWLGAVCWAAAVMLRLTLS